MVSVEAVNSIKQILQPLKKKRLTKAWKKRKEVIIKRPFYKKKMTLLQLSLFSSALIPLKEYVMPFQEAEPAIHKLYDNQFKVMRKFLANFIRPEVLVKHKDLIFIGSKGEKIHSKSRKNDAIVASFLKQALDAYVKCGNYLLKILPINNPLLQCLPSIDTLTIISHSEAALGLLLKLSSNLTPAILKSENDISEYEKRM